MTIVNGSSNPNRSTPTPAWSPPPDRSNQTHTTHPSIPISYTGTNNLNVNANLAPPPYSETAPSYSTPRQLTWAQAASGHAPVLGMNVHLPSGMGMGGMGGMWNYHASGSGNGGMGVGPSGSASGSMGTSSGYGARGVGVGTGAGGGSRRRQVQVQLHDVQEQEEGVYERGSGAYPRETYPFQPEPHKPRSFLEPLQLPSPFLKAPKSRVSNFSEGLKEGGRGAWAEVREGLKGPVGLTWYWTKEGGVLGGLAGLGYGSEWAIFASHEILQTSENVTDIEQASLIGYLLRSECAEEAWATILALCPFSASIAFLNHSSRGALRGVRSAQQRRRDKRVESKLVDNLSRTNTSVSTRSVRTGVGTATGIGNPLAMNRTTTMETTRSTRSRRSRAGNLLSRVTTAISDITGPGTSPVTPSDGRRSGEEGARIRGNTSGHTDGGEGEGEGEGAVVTPFSPTSPRWPDELAGSARQGKRRQDSSDLEMEVKWGGNGVGSSPISPILVSPSASGPSRPGLPLPGKEGFGIVEGGPDRPTQPSRLEMDTKWASESGFPILGAPLPPTDALHRLRLSEEGGNAEAGPSGTPQLETDLKWPVISPSSDNLAGSSGIQQGQGVREPMGYIDHTDMMESPPFNTTEMPLPTSLDDHTAIHVPPTEHVGVGGRGRGNEVEEDTLDMEMELKWKKELARAAAA